MARFTQFQKTWRVRLKARARWLTLSSFVMATGLVLVFGPLSGDSLVVFPTQLPWLLLPVFCFVAAYLQIEVHGHTQSFTRSLGDIPLFLGLFIAPPDFLIASYIVGGLVARSIRRRRFAIGNEYYNVAQGICGIAACILTFQACSPDANIFGVRDLLIAVAAMFTYWLVTEVEWALLMVFYARKVESSAKESVLGLFALAANLLVALALLVFVVHEPFMLVTMLAPTVLVWVAQKAAADSRSRALGMEFLYMTSELLHTSKDPALGTFELLGEIRNRFQSRIVELVVVEHGVNASRLYLEEGSLPTRQSLALTEDEKLLIDSLGGLTSSVRSGTSEGRFLTPLLNRHSATSGMAVRIDGGASEGFLLLADSTAAQKKFRQDDLTLLAALGVQVGGALERGELSQALASAVVEKAELAEQTLHDSLTDLGNRNLFNQKLAQITHTAARDTKYTAVMVIDLDDFKIINDTYGHAAGDEVLVSTGQRLKSVLRSSDVAARFGGDEFGLVIENLAYADDAATVARRVVGLLAENIAITVGKVAVRASVGVVLLGGGLPMCTSEELMRRADAAMYVAKKNGKGQFNIYNSDAERIFTQAESETAALKTASDRGQLHLLYSPVVVVAIQTPVSILAHPLWLHPQKGDLPPSEFLSFAQHGGLVANLGETFLRLVCADLQTMGKENTPSRSMRMSLPVFEKYVATRTFVDELSSLCDEADVDKSQLTLLLDQNLALNDFGELLPRLMLLADKGFGLGIADFGRGGKLSVKSLSLLPFREVHLSQDLNSISGSGPEAALVESICKIANPLGIDVVARSLESELELNWVTQAGVSRAEGAIVGSPVPLSEVLQWSATLPNPQPSRRHSKPPG